VAPSGSSTMTAAWRGERLYAAAISAPTRPPTMPATMATTMATAGMTRNQLVDIHRSAATWSPSGSSARATPNVKARSRCQPRIVPAIQASTAPRIDPATSPRVMPTHIPAPNEARTDTPASRPRTSLIGSGSTRGRRAS